MWAYGLLCYVPHWIINWSLSNCVSSSQECSTNSQKSKYWRGQNRLRPDLNFLLYLSSFVNLHIRMRGRIYWVITIFLSPGLGSVYNNEAQSCPLPLFSVHVYSYCLFMDTAGSPCMCDIMNSASWLHLIRAALLSVCCQHHQPPVWEAFIYFFI